MKCIGKLCPYFNSSEMEIYFICGMNGETYNRMEDADCSITQQLSDMKVKYAELVELSAIICELQED